MQPPTEFIKYQYRRLFHLSAAELEAEPADQFFTNLLIYGYIQSKKADDIKRNS